MFVGVRDFQQSGIVSAEGVDVVMGARAEAEVCN